MKIEKRPKTGGRKPGSVNRTTAEVKAWVMQILTENQETFEANLKIVDPEKHIEIIQKLLSFVLPKAQQAEPEPQQTVYKISVVDQETKTALEKIVNGELPEYNDEPGVKLELSNQKTAEKFAKWMNNEPMEVQPQPMEVQQEQPQAIEPPAPARAPAPMEVTYPTRSGYRNNRI